MSVIEFIILAIALSFEALIMMHGCASKTPIRLTKGLAESFVIAVVNVVLLLVGIWAGGLLRFTPESLDEGGTRQLLTDTDNLVYLGLMLFVAIRLLFRSGKKGRAVQPYDISRFSTAMLLGVAIGVNTFFVGLALGFRIPFGENVLRGGIPLVVIMTVFGFLGVMLGRREKEIRARRYTLIAVLLLLAFALKGAIWG